MKIGFVGLTIGQFAPPEDWYKLGWLWQAPHQEVAGVSALGFTLGIYHLIANFRLLQILRGNLLAEHHHNRSSGEPFRIWDPIYLLGHYLNSRLDVVKMICEPLLCFTLSRVLLQLLPKPFHFVSVCFHLNY